MTTCQILIGTLYARLGKELEESGMVDKHTWAPKKGLDLDETETEILKLWDAIIGICWGQDIYKMQKWADASNKIIEKMPEQDKIANQLLLCVHLFDEWLNEGCADFVTKALWKTKIARLKLSIINAVSEVSGEEIASHSYIAANNIARAISGRAMLDSKTRNKAKERLKRKLHIKDTV